VLSQIYGNEEKQVIRASCTLSPAEVKYCQLEQEALIPSLAAARIQRWSMLLSANDYSIRYRKAKYLVLPDYLSRHPAPVQSNTVETIPTFAEIAEVPVCHQKIAKELAKDPVLQQILAFIQQDW
jgi:hypothetical protein